MTSDEVRSSKRAQDLELLRGAWCARAEVRRSERSATRQPAWKRSPRLPDAARPETGREVTAAHALRRASAPDPPAMADRLALRPHRSAEGADPDRESSVVRPARIKHAAKYASRAA